MATNSNVLIEVQSRVIKHFQQLCRRNFKTFQVEYNIIFLKWIYLGSLIILRYGSSILPTLHL